MSKKPMLASDALSRLRRMGDERRTAIGRILESTEFKPKKQERKEDKNQ